MPRFPSLDGRPQLRRTGEALLNVALLLGLAALLAHWTWRFAAPPAVVEQAHPAPTADVDLGRAAGLFRAGQADGRPEAQATTLNVRLRGVFAGLGGRPAMAILNADGKDLAVARGGEIQPGVVLDAVRGDHVLLLNQGVQERLDLDALGGAAAGVHVPQQVTLRPREINEVIANPQDLRAKVRPVGDESNPGLFLTQVDPGGFAARLGLQSGDVLRTVNGQPVGSVEDLARLLVDATGTRQVDLTGERQNKPLMLSYRLQQ